MSSKRPSHKSIATQLTVLSFLAIVCVSSLINSRETKSAEQPKTSLMTLVAYQTSDQLLIDASLANPQKKRLQGTMYLELIRASSAKLEKEQVLASFEKEVSQTETTAQHRFEFRGLSLPPEVINVRCRFGEDKMETRLAQILVVKAHETSISAGREFFTSSTSAIRCDVHAVKSIAETVPLAGADVEIQLKDKDGKLIPLQKTKTDDRGIAEPRFQVPDLPDGTYKLLVNTKSTLGSDKLEQDVRIKTDSKILLVTDKPLYQPGQLIHIRALALQAFTLHPAGAKDLTFEVEDSKGNKVFKRSQKTSDYGIASIDFQLADEVNMGDYHIRAFLGDQQADKTVTVKRYVLPKFKTELTADKRFYLPKETLHADLQSDYFFGKPVAGGTLKVIASTFDVQFREFQTWEGKTDPNGHAKFEIKLPDYFVGQPLDKGNALVRLEAKITDTADHTETISKTYPVSNQPIQLSLVPEGGRLIPDMENRVYAAAIYPDGSPAVCEVNLWIGAKRTQNQPLASLKTNDAGLAEFTLTPKPKQIRQGPWEQHPIETLGGQQMSGGPRSLFDVYAEAKDTKGNAAHSALEVNCEPLGENILLRLDKAIFKAGDTLKVEARTSAGLPTVYLDLVKSGQTLLTRWLEVDKGRTDYRLDLPPTIFGTLEVHAYQILASGEIIRDTRVVYVEPADGLRIDVKSDKSEHKPGEEGKIHFEVRDTDGKPSPAALGVIVVDEAVYALQDMQPGLEKVYFTLQEELLKPQAQPIYRPAQSLDMLVRQSELEAGQQQIAQVLLTSIKSKPPARWQVAPAVERRKQVEGQVQQIGWGVYQYALGNPFIERDRATGDWTFKRGLLDQTVSTKLLQASALNDPLGKKWTIESLAKIEKTMTADRLAKAVTMGRIQQLTWALVNYTNSNQARWLKNGKWSLSDSMLADAAKNQNLTKISIQDAWGRPIRLVRHEKKQNNFLGIPQFDFYELVSAGPDGKLGTDDDLNQMNQSQWQLAQSAWFDDGMTRLGAIDHFGAVRMRGMERRLMEAAPAGGFGGGNAPAMKMMAAPMDAAARPKAALMDKEASKSEVGSAAPTRVREYFPETMLWQPALITDDQGRADLPVSFADSITTWRLSASASNKAGALGGVSAPLKVFQDFFVDIDLPVALTQNDEVAFPVAVYNYLKEPQTLKLELQSESWFELVDSQGLTRSLDLKPNEVTSVKFRIKAKKIGHQPLLVRATGSKMSDAVKRSIEVIPDGQKFERVVTDKLNGNVRQTVEIPGDAIPDASKLFVKIYPGVLSQVLEGTEGMLRLPGG
jgi:hypothetical protein